jgi:transposase
MSTISVSLTEKQFDEHIRPYISTAKRGYESKIPLFKVFNYVHYRLHTGCRWYQLPIAAEPSNPDKKEISYDAVYYHFRKWSRDGSLRSVWKHSIMTISLL